MLLAVENANRDRPLYRFLHSLAIRLQICWFGGCCSMETMPAHLMTEF